MTSASWGSSLVLLVLLHLILTNVCAARMHLAQHPSHHFQERQHGHWGPSETVTPRITEVTPATEVTPETGALPGEEVLSGTELLEAASAEDALVAHKEDATGFYTEEQRLMIEQTYVEQHQKVLEEISALQGDEFNSVQRLSVHDGGKKLLWDFFPPLYPCPIVWRAGQIPDTGDGAKWICGAPLINREKCVIYSFGSNGEVSFEKDMLMRTNCEVHSFDPTLSEDLKANVMSVPGLTFHEYGLGGVDGELEIDVALNTYARTGPTIAVKRLETIMQELGHDWIDVLKVDIEGSEYAFLENYVSNGQPIPATQLQVEFHHWTGSPQTVPTHIFNIMANLTNEGNMRVFHFEPNLWYGNDGREFVEYAFLHVSKSGHLMGPVAL